MKVRKDLKSAGDPKSSLVKKRERSTLGEKPDLLEGHDFSKGTRTSEANPSGKT